MSTDTASIFALTDVYTDDSARIDEVRPAHRAFLRELQSYLAALPAQLLQGLNEQAKLLYNAFNRGDRRPHLGADPARGNAATECDAADRPTAKADFRNDKTALAEHARLHGTTPVNVIRQEMDIDSLSDSKGRTTGAD